jgi:hypothetical protein
MGTQLKLLLHLPPGTVFHIPSTGRTGVLHHANESRAHVSYLGEEKSRTITAHKGTPKEKTFTVPDRSSAIDITSNVEVEVITLGGGASAPPPPSNLEELLS